MPSTDIRMKPTAGPIRAAGWLAALSWAASLALAMLPIYARIVDPAPKARAIDPENLLTFGRFLLDVAASAVHRSWMLPTTIGLATVAVLALAAIAFVLWRSGAEGQYIKLLVAPTVGFGILAMLAIYLDIALPEFAR